MKLPQRFFWSTSTRDTTSVPKRCGLRSCPNTLLFRVVARTQVGIRVGPSWYCGIGCFAEAAMEQFSTGHSEDVVEMPHRPRLSIGLAMLSRRYVTDEQLRSAILHSQKWGKGLENTLIELGMASEWQLASGRAAQWGYPVLGQDYVSQAVDVDIPITLLRACAAVPVHHSATTQRMLLGFVERVDHCFLNLVEKVTGCSAEPCFITQTAFDEQMSRIVVASNYQESVLDELQQPEQMAKATARFALEVNAREASFAEFRDYFWARLTGKSRRIDLLFRARNATDTGWGKDSLHFAEQIRSLG